MILESAHIEIKEHFLEKPYVLSFATIEKVTSVVLHVFIEGKEYISEVVPLYGYNEETEEKIVDYLNDWVADAPGKNIYDLRAEQKVNIKNHPFSVSPILVALDSFILNFKVIIEKIDFVIPTSHGEILTLDLNSNKEFKLKLSGDVETDIESLKLLQKSHLKVRADANQIYSRESASAFFKKILMEGLVNTIHYIEQPVSFDDWETLAYLKQTFPEVPIMLDESVIIDEDIWKAKKIGIEFIKLKLFKQGGIIETIRQAQLNRFLGIETVIGNGVATSISNKIENTIYSQYKECFFGASEANGFLKLLN